MQRHCAVFRTGALLEEGADRLIIAMMRDLGVADRSMMFNTDLTEALELVVCIENLSTAIVVMKSAQDGV
jgi:succinate dehydrogenase/fumarate reductase flavoprotein subunit